MWLARASRCSPWPNTKSSGGDAPLPPPLSSGAQGLFHGSVSFLGLSSLLLQRERTAADQTLLSCSFWLPPPRPPSTLPPSVPQSLAICLSHRPMDSRCPASALPHQVCLAGAVLVCARLQWLALWEPSPGVCADSRSPVLPLTPRIPLL